MKKIEFNPCECEGCWNLATVIGGEPLAHCFAHLTPNEKEFIAEHMNKKECLRCSVFDGRRDSTRYPYHPFEFPIPVEADFQGSIFIGIDLNSKDLARVDFSFCIFTGCDLRRSRLFNSSLRWAVFNKSLIRQVDMSNSDCRWMRASFEGEDCRSAFSATLQLLADMKSDKSPLHLVGRDDAKNFFNRFGFTPKDNESELFLNEAYSELKELVHDRNDCPCFVETGCESQNGNGCLRVDVCSLTPTDWSGSSLRECDFAYSNFDGSKAQEVSFDSSDLHGASFCMANVQRSSFLNVSFSRVEKKKPCRSNFKKAQMQECVLDSTNLSGLYFQETNLNYASLKNAHIENTVFFECSMTALDANDVIADGCKFYASDLSSSSFSAASLRRTSFSFEEDTGLQVDSDASSDLITKWNSLSPDKRKTKLIATNFTAAELEQAKLNNTALTGASLQAANLSDAELKDATCVGANFTACNVDGVDFTKANLTACSLSDAGINQTPPIFKETNLSSADFSGMELSNVKFINVNMENANLQDCSLVESHFKGSCEAEKLIARRTSFSNADLTGAIFEYVDFESCNMSFTVTRETGRPFRFSDCNLSLINFSGASLINGKFTKCAIKKTNLNDSSFEKITIDRCNMESSSFISSDFDCVKIINPESLSDIDLSNSNIINDCCICCDHSRPPLEAHTVIWERAYAEKLSLSNIHFIALIANYSAFEEVEIDNVCFSTTSFNSAKLTISKHYNSHFFYCKFPLANLSTHHSKDSQTFTTYLGCDFVETALPEDPNHMIFVDCYFNLSSFLATVESVKKWVNAVYVYCRFEDLKYFGLREEQLKINQEKRTSSKHKDGALLFKDFLKDVRKKTAQSTEQLLTSSDELVSQFPIAGRLKALLPSREQLEREDGYGLANALCREFRRDFKNHSLEELSTNARIEEKNYLLMLKALQSRRPAYQCIGKIAAKIPFSVVAFIIVYMSFLFSKGANFFSICPFFFPAILILPTFFSAGRLFASKHLYKYGENVVRMALSVLMCILSYAILYYGFVPENDKPQKICTNIPACNGEYALVHSFLSPALKDSVVTGCLVTENHVLTTNGNWWQSFLTCFYFSGVTFTTLGYGDISPHGVVRYLAFTEAALGAFMIALLVFVFTKRDN